MAGGTGTEKLAVATIAVAGVASLIATLMSFVSIWLQTKHYQKPLLQRFVVRILVMVPIYSIASWVSLVSFLAAEFLDPIRDIYEAFTIYTFFQLLVNNLGGERAIIISTHGRKPVNHLWPMNYVLPPVDISDPHTFLMIKRGVLQYAWLKPVLGISAIAMKATDTYQEGYIGLSSGYMWEGIVYNISVTLCLYYLALFWVCLHDDLLPFRPVPKFLCVKLIIFASYWQGLFLSILVAVGAIPDNVDGYTRDNLAAAIQDALICIEMPIFAAAHWYAFSWHDYAHDDRSAARMPVWYAFRDAFGVKDLIADTKETFSGDKYKYRDFDSGDAIIAHEDSKSRVARLKAGMRYERGGKGKYWVPTPGEIDESTSLLRAGSSSRSRSRTRTTGNGTMDEPQFDPLDEQLFDKARELEHGDFNYPVVAVDKPRRQGWTTPESDSATPSRTRSHSRHNGKEPEAVQVKKKKSHKKDKGKAESSTPAAGAIVRKPSPPLAHEEDAGPSGFGTANEDYSTVTKEYLEAAAKIGYDGRVKDKANEGPEVEGSEAWKAAQKQEEEEVLASPAFSIGSDEESQDVWRK